MEGKGLTGLANLGNTCFINSCMQVLSHTHKLNDFFNNNGGNYREKLSVYHNKEYLLDSKLLVEWDNLRKLMWQKDQLISPGGFVKAVQSVAKHKKIDIFSGYAQNDLPEFLLFILDTFHNGMRREVDMVINGQSISKTDKMAVKCYEMMKAMYSKEYSEMLDIFYGIHVSKIEKGGELMSIKPEPYFIIDIPIQMKTGLTIYNCFEKYCSGEKLEGENGWFNEKTNKKEDVVQTIVFWSLPEILVLDLKRFTPDGRKIQVPLNIETDELDLSKFVEGYGKEQYKYELYGVCNHSGGTLGGHYTATIRVTNNEWYLFNDTNVSKIEFDGKNNTSGYCLFYRKKLNK
jgi:ubiquitin carboxyl-terminal hydrolase 8